MHIVVRGPNVTSVAPALRSLVLSLDPAMPPFNVRTLQDDVSRVVAGPAFAATLLALFAAVALVRAAIAVSGVMAYAARLRTREIGVRIALGSTRRQACQLLARDGTVAIGVGVLAGLFASVWLARWLAGALPELASPDPWALLAAAALLVVVALVAAILPARRAAWRSPVDAMRAE